MRLMSLEFEKNRSVTLEKIAVEFRGGRTMEPGVGFGAFICIVFGRRLELISAGITAKIRL